MRKLLKGALIAGAAGAALGGVQALRKDETTEVVAQQAVKGAAEGIAFGALVGLFLDRRDKKKRAKRRARFGAALTTGGLVEAARAARPALEHAIEVSRPRVEQAAGVARDRAVHAAEAARPHVEHAAEVARDRAVHAAESARPRVEQAARVARERAQELSRVA